MDDELDIWQESEHVPVRSADMPYFEQIKTALENKEWIEIQYLGGSNPGQKRLIKPLEMFRVEGYSDIYLRAFCAQRNEERTFRLDKLSVAGTCANDITSQVSEAPFKAKNIDDRILEQIELSPGSKASHIAKKLGIDRKQVNAALYGRLRLKVQQDKNYRWWLKEAKLGKKPKKEEPRRVDTPLAQLCQYYLDCLSHDDLGGISVFAESKYDDLDYVELPKLPMLNERADNLFNLEEGRRLLDRVRRDRNRKTLFIGYPVRLNLIRSKRGWEGFLVEPLLLFSFEESTNYSRPTLSDAPPQINFRALRALSNVCESNLMEEAVQLAEELALGNIGDEQPELDELIARLHEIRSDWDWQEKPDPEMLTSEPAIANIRVQGIYNRAVFISTEHSPYTRGLESELGMLQSVDRDKYNGTAIGKWLSGQTIQSSTSDQKPLLEVLPLNSEQRQAVRQALTNPLTVITGPPGTGKSQVVTSILINAAWQGKTVLFASKNNKAVDVVETRVNGLGPRPILLRLGANQYQSRLAEYLISLLAATTTADDQARYEEAKLVHANMQMQSESLDNEIASLINIRNEVDQLEQTVENIRQGVEPEMFKKIKHIDLTEIVEASDIIQYAIRRADCNQQIFFSRLFWPFIKKKRYELLYKAAKDFRGTADTIASVLPSQRPDDSSIRSWIIYGNDLSSQLEQWNAVKNYFLKLEELTGSRPLEEISRLRSQLAIEVANNSEMLWRYWLHLQPSRMTQEQRRLLGDYSSLLQMVVSANESNERLGRQVFRKYYQLFPKITSILSSWAVTSLSARGRIPFAPNFFDLLVIDEASQCDIASALPLLYRTRNAVIIGDPKQLRHISTLSKQQDQQLLTKYNLVNEHAGWAYSTRSLFDLASSLCRNEDIIALRDHHRSHADIIEFSNKHFYESRLRIATNYDRLYYSDKDVPAVRWVDVKGNTKRPGTGGAVNDIEAKAVVNEIQRLIAQGYKGSIGVVSPFRAQANKIRDLVFNHDHLGARIADLDFLADTVHKFQGDERDIMIFSPTISDGVTEGALGFLRSNPNLFNVAITRARSALIVVGDKLTAMNCNVDYLTKFASYTESLGAQQTKEEQYSKEDLGPEYPPVSQPELVSEWEHLFYRVLYKNGLRPIPQYSVEKYILDFALVYEKRRLNIEIDGERYHRNWDGELCRRDQIRNQRLIELGWDVMRFWVYQVRDDIDGCMDRIQKWLNESEDK